MPKINPESVRTMIQWLGLKNDGRMESDRGLIEETYDCPFVKTYNSPDGKLTANYSCGYLVSIAYNDVYVAVHTDLDGTDIIRCTFEDEDFNEYEYTI